MKTLFRRGLFAALIFFAPGVLHANDYKSIVLAGNTSLASPINISGDQFLVIKSFTQQGGVNRGTVTVMIGSQSAIVLTASIVDNPTMLEPVNSLVVAGLATVSVTCGSDATTCFVTYRKESN